MHDGKIAGNKLTFEYLLISRIRERQRIHKRREI